MIAAMECDLELEEEADKVFNDTLQDVADSLEARDPETESCGRAETPSKVNTLCTQRKLMAYVRNQQP